MTYTQSAAESKELDNGAVPMIIISASGMGRRSSGFSATSVTAQKVKESLKLLS